MGGDLRFHLKKQKGNKFPEAQVKFYISQTILALEHLHIRNVLHRDIKPDNLLLDEMGYIKLSDFGASRIVLPDVVDGTCREGSGTPGVDLTLMQGR